MRDRMPRDREATTPGRLPDTTPPVYPSGDYSYILEVVMAMQKSMGGVEQAVKTLGDDAKEAKKKLDRISHIIYAAGVVGTIGIAIFVFLANKLTDAFIASLKH